MSVRDDIAAAAQTFTMRLDDATAEFAAHDSPDNIAGATKYMSQQLILLTDLCGALVTAVKALDARVDALDCIPD